MSPDDAGIHDQDAGVFVMRCWVREDGELAGRVRWSTVHGDQEIRLLGGADDVVDEVQQFLRRVGSRRRNPSVSAPQASRGGSRRRRS